MVRMFLLLHSHTDTSNVDDENTPSWSYEVYHLTYQCNGTENSLISCTQTECVDTSEMVGVQCQGMNWQLQNFRLNTLYLDSEVIEMT